MAITNAQIQAEIDGDPAGLGYSGCGAIPIYQKMTAPGSSTVEAWVVSPEKVEVNINELLVLIKTVEEAAAFYDFEATVPTGLAKALMFKLTKTPTIDMANAENRGMIAAITAPDDTPTAVTPLKSSTRDAMLKIGEIQQSRALELWGEHPTLDQIRGVLNG